MKEGRTQKINLYLLLGTKPNQHPKMLGRHEAGYPEREQGWTGRDGGSGDGDPSQYRFPDVWNPAHVLPAPYISSKQ